jgi:GNAT superfamily N-acetyltransferase
MIRDGRLEDAARAAPMRQRAWPDMIITEQGMRHSLASVPERAQLALFAYEEGDRISGWASAGRAWWQNDPGYGTVTIAVDPERRGIGIASKLAEAADAHLAALGIGSARTESLDEPAARALASRWGFIEIGASSTSAVDPRTVEPLPVPAGVAIVPFAELSDPEPVYLLDLEASADIPNESFESIPLEEWVREYWRGPMIDAEASLAAIVDGEVVAATMIRLDRPSGRAHNNLTGTLRAYRGRGLATVLKSHSLRRAAELGATIAVTDNDETNAPMLAVNAKLGYRPFARRLVWVRRPSPSAGS